MKVLHVIPSISAWRGGPSQTIRLLGQGLINAGIDVHVATTDDDGVGRDLRRSSEPDFQGGTLWRFSRQFRPYTLSRPLSRWVERHIEEFDLVHIHSLFSYPTTACAHWARKRRIPYVVRPLGSLTRSRAAHGRRFLRALSVQAVEGHILSGARWVHYASDFERSEAAWLNFATRSRVIPNPVAEQASVPTAKDNEQTILFLSRLDPIKGLDLLLAAFAGIRKRFARAKLVIAGAGASKFVAWARAESRRLNIQSHVSWVGFVEGDQKEKLFRQADLFVLPSYSESFGMAVAEALSYGVPVLVSNRVGLSPLIANYEAGLVSACDAKDLEERIASVLGDDISLRSMGENGRRLVKSELSISSVASQLKQEYVRTIAST